MNTDTTDKFENTAVAESLLHKLTERGIGGVDSCPSPVNIGPVAVSPPLVLAPMAGVTNHAFRLICKQAGGVGLTCAEMISAFALTYGSARTRLMMDWTDEERPVSVQIFGPEPAAMAEAARQVAEAGADIVDINIGCPVPKVIRTGAAAALLRDLPLTKRIIRAVVEAVDLPVTIKTRSGWDLETETAVELARIAEDSGAKAVTVHGRTVRQGYQGEADWGVIGRVKQAVGLTVIGNGDVRSPEDASRMFDRTGCDAVMIARGALGNPWIFRGTEHYLKTGQILPEPSLAERLEAARRHALLLCQLLGEERGARELRGQLAWYIKGTRGAPRVRASLTKARTLAEIEEALNETRG